MRKTFWIIPVLLLAALGAVNARADEYTVTFSGCSVNSGTPLLCTSLGPTTTDVTFSASTGNGEFTLYWDTDPFTLSAGALGPDSPSDTFTWSAIYNGVAPATFTINDMSNGNSLIVPDLPAKPQVGTASGMITFTDVPEPTTTALMFLAILPLAFMMRKRMLPVYVERSVRRFRPD